MTRSDALRNRERVIEAATAVFAERGMAAGVEEVALRAGVGKATVYRSFPTKEHLYAAVAVQRARWFEEQAEAALERPDAFAALEELLLATAEMQARDRVVGSSLAGTTAEVPDLVEARERAKVALERVVARAVSAGSVRSGVVAEDIGTLYAGFSRVLAERGERDPDVWRRYARLVVAAVRS